MPNALPVMPFPAIDPVALAIGPFDVRWYAIAYIAGLILGWRFVLRTVRLPGAPMAAKEVDDFIVWATIGVVLGGRLGYVLFYRPGFYALNPEHILYLWQGGMSFHGGLLGVAAAIVLFSRMRGLRLLEVSDVIAAAAPIGLFFGRIANFINAELFGRPSEALWAVIFPTGGPAARHPSQLYEAALEGLALFAVILVLVYATRARWRPGLITGVFLAGYGIARIVVEIFREPDAHLLEIMPNWVTMGQILSLPVLGVGAYLIARAMTQPPRPAET